MMNIVRSEHKFNFTVNDNRFLDDKRLKPSTRFLFTQILRLCDSWNFTIIGMSKYLELGRDFVTSGIKQLEEFGYVHIDKKRKQGRFDYTYFFYEHPSFNPYINGNVCKPEPEKKTPVENVTVGDSVTEKTVNHKKSKAQTYKTYDSIIDNAIPNEPVNSKFRHYFFKVRYAKLRGNDKHVANATLEGLIERLLNLSNDVTEQLEMLDYGIRNNCDIVKKPKYKKNTDKNNSFSTVQTATKNKFNNFTQRQYSEEYLAELERKLLMA